MHVCVKFDYRVELNSIKKSLELVGRISNIRMYYFFAINLKSKIVTSTKPLNINVNK